MHNPRSSLGHRSSPIARPISACLRLLGGIALLAAVGVVRPAETVEILPAALWPGYVRGPASGVAVEGGYAYLAAGAAGLQVIDVRDPIHCVRVGGFETTGANAWDVAVKDQYAYLADGTRNGKVIDARDPARCTLAGLLPGRTDRSGRMTGLALAGTHVYTASGDGGLEVFDATDPHHSAHVGGWDATGVTTVAVQGDFAYVSLGSELRFIKVSEPANCVELGSFPLPGSGNALQVGGHQLYVAAHNFGLQVLSSDPTNSVKLGEFLDPSGLAWGVHVSGSLAYVAWGTQGLRIVDVGDPSRPQARGGYAGNGFAKDVVVADRYAYVANNWSGFRVIDVSDPAACAPVCELNTGGEAHRIAWAGKHAYVADQGGGLQILNTQDRTNLVWVGSCSLGDYVTSVAVSGDYVYVTDENGLQVIDARIPAQATRLGGYAVEGALSVTVRGPVAYVGTSNGSTGQLVLVDVSDPANCRRLSTLPTGGGIWDIAVAGHYAYLAAYTAGLQIAEVQNPTQPSLAGTLKPTGLVYGVTVNATNAYLAAYDAGLHVVDITDPAHCVRVGGFNTSGHARHVALLGPYALVADGSRGLQVIDVSNPTNCVRVASHDTPGYTTGLALNADRVLLADGAWGVGAMLLSLPGQSQPKLSPGTSALGPSGFTFTVEGLSSLTPSVVSATEDFVAWTPLQTNAVGVTAFSFVDAAATNLTRRYYRVEQR